MPWEMAARPSMQRDPRNQAEDMGVMLVVVVGASGFSVVMRTTMEPK